MMSNYRRAKIPGGSYFITQVTHHRQPWLITDIGRKALRTAIIHVRQKYPLTVDAFVLLPDHFHCLWTLPEGDSDLATNCPLKQRFPPLDKNAKSAISGKGDFGSIGFPTKEILPNIATIFMTIPFDINFFLIPRIGNFPVFIDLFLRGAIHLIGEKGDHSNIQKCLGFITLIYRCVIGALRCR